MIIVDAHANVGRYWLEPVEVLLFQMEQNGVEKAVLKQYTINYDNGYMMECVRKHPGRFAAVVRMDIQRPDATDALAALAQEGAVGLRLNPEWRTPGSDPLALWRKASDLGLVVSCQGYVDTLATDGFRSVVEELPDLKIVIEHLGHAQEPDFDYEQFDKVMTLAEYPNTYIQLPGFGQLLSRPKTFPFHTPPWQGPPRSVRMAYDAFGPRRMMWGSDYPPAGGREGYANTLRYPMELIPYFSEDDKERVFGKTAVSVWKFR